MVNNQKFKRLVLSETSSEIDKYLRENSLRFESELENEILFIALTPSVYSKLRRKGLRVNNTLRYFTNESHKNLLKKSEVIIDWLRENTKVLKPDGSFSQSMTDTFIFLIRFVVHYCLWIIEIISNAIEIHQPEILSAGLSGRKFVYSLYAEPEEEFLGVLVKKIASLKGLDFENTLKKEIRNCKFYPPKLINQITFLLGFLARYVRFEWWAKKVEKESKFFVKPPIFLSSVKNTDKIIDEFNNDTQERPYYFLKGPIVLQAAIPDFLIKLFWNTCREKVARQKIFFNHLEKIIAGNRDIFLYKGVDFAELISRKLKNNLSWYSIGQGLWMTRLGKFFDIVHPYALISTGSRLDDIVIAEMCKEKNIPNILISHGSHVYPKDEYERIEWGEHGRSFLRANFSFLALQSPMAEGYLKVFPAKGQTFKSGPLVWGGETNKRKSKILFEKIFKGKYQFGKIKVILHAGTPKLSKSLRLYVYETQDEYLQGICELAEVVEKISNTVLIIRFRALSGLNSEDIRNFVPFSKKVVLNEEGSFIETLGMADLLVSFSSTTIEEALQNRIPVLLYGGRGRYQHVPAYEVISGNSIQPSAVYHVKEVKYLEYAISRILKMYEDKDRYAHLFDSYAYPSGVRTPFVNLLKDLCNRRQK